MGSTEIIGISSDSDEGPIMQLQSNQVPARRRGVKIMDTEAQSRRVSGYGVVPSVDKDIDDIPISSPGKRSHKYDQKWVEALGALPGPSFIPPQKLPRRRKVSLRRAGLDNYARELFKELNTSVFDKRLPDTELVWNVRFCTTAGRAVYHRDKNSDVITKIELSPKVVDSKDRVKCVLAHEMCHLAVWVLDGDPTEKGHGAKFKRWASRVENIRQDVVVNTTHSYEINYKYRWECIQCGKIYGRHSNSIDIEKNACGKCAPPGSLRSLFEMRPGCKDTHKKHRKPPTATGKTYETTQTAEAESSGCSEKRTYSDQEIETLLSKLLDLSV